MTPHLPDSYLEHKWLTVEEAAARVRRTPHTFRVWCRRGDVLPPGVVHQPTGPKGSYLIDREALDDWVRNGCFTRRPGDGNAA